MKYSKLSVGLLLIACFLLTDQATAQNKISKSVFGNGGAAVSNGSNRIIGTVGQSFIGQASNNSNTNYSGFWYQALDFITSVEQVPNAALPKEFRLEQNYPNPFNPSTTIEFALPERSRVTLKLFDLRGREVATLVDEEFRIGAYKVAFDAVGLPSGIYFYRISAHSPAGGPVFVQVKKLTLLK